MYKRSKFAICFDDLMSEILLSSLERSSFTPSVFVGFRHILGMTVRALSISVEFFLLALSSGLTTLADDRL